MFFSRVTVWGLVKFFFKIAIALFIFHVILGVFGFILWLTLAYLL